jgi:hypothetical protein
VIDIEKLRTIAEDLASNATDSDSAQKAAVLAKLIAEIENQQSSSRKLQTETEDILRRQKESNKSRLKDLITSVTPLLTTAILAGTLIFQAYSFKETERDKTLDTQRQAELAEKTRWADALKVLSTSEGISPASALLQSFTTSPYKEYARSQVFRLLLQKTNNPEVFSELFKTNLVPVNWDSADEVFQLNKRLFAQLNPLLLKQWNPNTRSAIESRLSTSERLQKDNLLADIDVTLSAILPLLKSSRPPDKKLDVEDMSFYSADLSRADLHDVSIEGCDFDSTKLEGADMSGIKSFAYTQFVRSTWWHAAKISPPLLAFLAKQFPFDPKGADYPAGAQLSESDYQTSLERLHKLNGE